MEEIHNNRPLVEALATMVAFADEACFGIGILPTEQTDALLVEGQYRLLSDSLCRDIHNSRAVVLPKLHNSKYGMTIRSLTHHLALWDKMEVLPRWKTAPLDLDVGLNVMLFPWPLAVKPRSFSVQKNTCGEHMPKSFGMFTYDLQTSEVDVDRVMSLLRRAETLVGRVDALIFPELSMTRPAFEALQQRVQQRLLIAGVGTEGTEARLGKNEVVVSWRDADSIDQSKHHRWRLDEYQIEQYGLGPSLAAKKWWWEAIDMRQRCCTFINVNEWFTFCALICEDLARQDPVAELVRSVGPNLVVALLMDGPQTPERWSARYATVLAEDPRSSVLTLTAAGLVDLARSQREGRPRSIALWKDAINPGARQILLEEGSEAVVLTLTSVMKKEWTADARHDMGSTGYLKLTATHQIGPAAGTEGSADVVISR